jgi:hypothetical protein
VDELEIERLARLAEGMEGRLVPTDVRYLSRTIRVLVFGTGERLHRPITGVDGAIRTACNVRWKNPGSGVPRDHARPCRRCLPTDDSWFAWVDEQSS